MKVKFNLRMYGDYACSCGCGKPLGNPSVYDREICKCVGDEYDDDGYKYRCFTSSCWDRLKLDDMSADEIYEKYDSPVAYQK